MESDEEDQEPLPLTGFLFGNIDQSGQLEDDLLDQECKQHLNQLSRLSGMGSLLKEITKDVSKSLSDDDNEEDEEENDDNGTDGWTQKSPSAVDYSDITELADEEEYTKCRTILSALNAPKSDNNDVEDYDADDEDNRTKTDSELMPPPPIPPPKSNSEEDEKNNSDGSYLNESETSSAEQFKKLNTPLAAMLPSKYLNMNVQELFPEFRAGKVLRFSRLFGPGKPSSLPQIWCGVKKRKRKRVHSDDEHKSDKGWTLKIALPLLPDQCQSDDEEKLMKPMEAKSVGAKVENGTAVDDAPKVADWRYGPAQLWYDMLDVSESGDDFDYGFKLKEANDAEEETKISNENDEYSDDCYHMVTQLQWEDDVVWNGDDIKHKVMAKLNSKNNAAGWLPSSSNRTAQAFSQQAKTTPHPVVHFCFFY